MILIKSFFRKKSTKLYLFILIIVLSTITLLINFIGYYTNIINITYQHNSYFVIKGVKNNYDELKKIKYISNINRVILLEPDFSNNFFNNTNITWPNLLDIDNEFIIVISQINNNIDLNDDNAILELSHSAIKNFDNIYDLKKKIISFKIKSNNIKFKLQEIFESNFLRLIISNNKFKQLLDIDNSYDYIFSINDYSKINFINEYLGKIDGVNEVKFVQSYESESIFNTIKELKSVIFIMKYACLIFTIILLIIFLIIIRNIINDELEKMLLKRLLGYSKRTIKSIIIKEVLILNLLAILISIVSSSCITILIKTFIRIDNYQFNILVLLKMYTAFLLIPLFYCLFLKIDKIKNSYRF